MTKDKTVFVCEIPCPHCKESVTVMKKTKVLSAAIKAEKEENFFSEKGIQQTLK